MFKTSLLPVVCLLAVLPAPVFSQTTLQGSIYSARDKVISALVHVEPVMELYAAGQKEKLAVTGSGFIISSDGLVLTNSHVVQQAKYVKCVLNDKEEVTAEIVGDDPYTDVALLRLNLKGYNTVLQPAELGDSGKLEVGEMVLAMGSPLGLSRSVSQGVVSALNRFLPETEIQPGVETGLFNTWIQTDAAINPGNSGGPLVNLEGKVVGMNSRAILIVGENLGFAIPINVAKDVIESLLKNGYVKRGWLGLRLQNMKGAAGYFGIDEKEGVLVSAVEKGSPAEKAGIKPGDVILSINTAPVSARFEEELPEVRKRIAELPIGQNAILLLLRAGKKIQKRLSVAELPRELPEEFECKALKLTVREITSSIARQKKLTDRKGVLVTGVVYDGPSFQAGLRPQDVISLMTEVPVENIKSFKNLCGKISLDKTKLVYVEANRGKSRLYAVVEPKFEEEKKP